MRTWKTLPPLAGRGPTKCEMELLDKLKSQSALMDDMAEALRELKSIVNIHSHVTRNNFAWAEVEQADDVLTRYEESKK